jgi:hypothetical protein
VQPQGPVSNKLQVDLNEVYVIITSYQSVLEERVAVLVLHAMMEPSMELLIEIVAIPRARQVASDLANNIAELRIDVRRGNHIGIEHHADTFTQIVEACTTGIVTTKRFDSQPCTRAEFDIVTACRRKLLELDQRCSFVRTDLFIALFGQVV